MVSLHLDCARALICELSERIHACREYRSDIAVRDLSAACDDAEMLAFCERWIAVLEGRAA